MPISNSVSDLLGGVDDFYSVTSSIGDKQGLSTTKVTGDRETDTFKDGNEMDKDAFLLLLTAQMQNQDPLEPMDNTQMVSQLAQYSELEATNNMEASLSDMSETFGKSLSAQTQSAQSLTNASAVSLVGKEVRLKQSTFDWVSNGDVDFTVQMGGKSSVDVEILDDEGEIVTTITVDEKDSTNAGKFSWDGKNINGQAMPVGDYALYISGQEEDSSLYCFVEDTVSGIRYDSKQGSLIKVAGQEMPIGNILEVNTASSNSGNSDVGFGDLTMGQALTLVGKEVKVKDPSAFYTPSLNPALNETKKLEIDLNSSTDATVVIKDISGNIQQRIPLYIKMADVDGNGDAILDADGNPTIKTVLNDDFKYEDGKLVLELPKTNHNGSSKYNISLESNSGAFFSKTGKITGVLSTPTGVQLKTDGLQLSLKDIIEVSEIS
jgi:flagellar basal-body rod modification protein FlgD